MIKFLLFIGAVLGTAYGLDHDGKGALAFVCWALAVVIAFWARSWCGWGVIAATVLMMLAEEGAV